MNTANSGTTDLIKAFGVTNIYIASSFNSDDRH